MKFYGVYTVTLGKFKRHLIAMPNVLKSDLSIDEVYDLKALFGIERSPRKKSMQ